MKKALLCLLLVCGAAFAGPNDFIFMQRNALDTGNIQRVIASPATTGFFTYNATTKLGGYTTFGAGLTWSNGVLSADVTPGPTGATGAAGPKGDKGDPGANGANGQDGAPGTTDWNGITNKPLTFAPSAHTHVIGDVPGLQAALNTKFATPAGTTAQYIRGDGSLATLDAYPAASNPAGYLTSITGAQVTTALGLAPVSQSGARSAISLTTTGSGAATYNASTGVLNVPTQSSVIVPTINRAAITTAADGTFTWTMPVACATGQLPVVSVTPENSNAGEIINHKLTGRTNTTVSISVSRAVITLNGLLGLNIPVLQTSPGAATVHLIAICP